MKIIEFEDDSWKNEIRILKKLSHENVVKYMDHFELNMGEDSSYNQIRKVCIVTEYCEVGPILLF